MSTAQQTMQKRSMSNPDETRLFDRGKLDLITLGSFTFGRATLEPGWKWSQCVKPLAGTDSCQAPHLQYHVSGCLHVVMEDGAQDDFVAGDISMIGPGHDAWVVGNEPVVIVDVTGMLDYAKRK